MKGILLGVFAPAGAIAAGALSQLALTSVWPGAQNFTIANVTIDSYLAIVAIAALSFWVGSMLWRRAPARSTILVSLLAPVGWLLGLLFAAYTPPLALSALSVVYLFSALAPLLGIALAYALASDQPLERP